MMSRGGRVVAGVGLTSVTRIFPYFEAYPAGRTRPGRVPPPPSSDPTGTGRWTPTSTGCGARRRRRFPPGRGSSRTTGAAKGPNGVGYPFLRGASSGGMDSEHKPAGESLFAFLERQDGYRANHEWGV
jgi:hypothetical protein